MNEAPVLDAAAICGFYELNAQGTVLYARAKQGDKLWKPAESLRGHDFFAEILEFTNVEALRRRFSAFVSSQISTDNFRFAPEFAGRMIPLKVLLVRVMENNAGGREPVFYIDIKQDEYQH